MYTAPDNPESIAHRLARRISGGVIVDWRDRLSYAFNMADIVKPAPGRLVVSVVYAQIDALADCLRKLERSFGRVQFETGDIPFSGEARHQEEMGDNLQRRFFSFEQVIDRERVIDAKRACRKIEEQFADQVDDFFFRAVNIDPGIMTPDNLMMSSYRETHYRVYLGRGVFAQLELVFARGRFVALPWTSQDFCHDDAVEFFERVRQSLDPATMDDMVRAARQTQTADTSQYGVEHS